MNRTLIWLNLLGVIALVVLSGFQWRANRALNLDINALQKTTQTQAASIAEQEKKVEEARTVVFAGMPKN